MYNLGHAFGPGSFGLAIARLLLRNEPSPTYPYRNFVFRLKYFFCKVFEPSPAYPYRGNFKFNYVFCEVFQNCFIFLAMPSARATPGSLRSVIAAQ